MASDIVDRLDPEGRQAPAFAHLWCRNNTPTVLICKPDSSSSVTLLFVEGSAGRERRVLAAGHTRGLSRGMTILVVGIACPQRGESQPGTRATAPINHLRACRGEP
jgi:hypothetical protein